MINTQKFDQEAVSRCYFPIFVVNSDEEEKAKDTWYLGNIFLDKYLVINDIDKREKYNNEINLQVGIYNK